MSRITTRTLSCGMDVIVETIPGVKSAGLSWLITGGSAREPHALEGLGAMWSDLLFRGAGSCTARQHADALDRLGASRDADVQTFFMRLAGTMLGDRVADALPLFADMALAPRMEEEAVEPVRDLCLQSLESLADDPHERVMLLAREKHAPAPINRSGLGRPDSLEAISRDDLVTEWRRLAKPRGSVMAIAGAVDADAVEDRLNELLMGWTGAATDVTWPEEVERGYHHLDDDTNQVHIALVHDAPREADTDAMLERVITSVLSGGMSGRLFTEVREKRGLVYSVNASYAASRDFGRVAAYAGTTPDKAQETLDVLIAELRRLSRDAADGGVSEAEFQRAVIGMKSNLVMSGESTSARAAALATDWFRVGRPRSLEERAAEVDALTLDQVNAYIARRDLGALTVVTIGPKPLAMPT